MPQDPLERIRDVAWEVVASGESMAGTGCGFFRVRRAGVRLKIIASDGLVGPRWEHVSVSAPGRCPTWDEMCCVKNLFWAPEECVLQLHPPQSEWVNNHPFTLHLWRPLDVVIPQPPSTMVGFRDLGVLDATKAEAHLRLMRGARR